MPIDPERLRAAGVPRGALTHHSGRPYGVTGRTAEEQHEAAELILVGFSYVQVSDMTGFTIEQARTIGRDLRILGGNYTSSDVRSNRTKNGPGTTPAPADPTRPRGRLSGGK